MDAFYKRIENLNSGKEMMVTDAGIVAVSAASDIPWSSTDGYQPTFGMGDILDAEVDQDRVDDEEAAK